MDQVTILLEVDKRLFDEKATQGILDECRHTFGEDMKVEIKVVDEIPRATSGKFRMIINKVV
jgi:phenylacetate-coenzyme A ligase PaaK-like adenylate-forming protein